MKELIFTTTKDLPMLEQELAEGPDEYELMPSLGWTYDGPKECYGRDLSNWKPPTDQYRDQEYYALFNSIDWKSARRCGFPREEFEESGHNRDTRLHIMETVIGAHPLSKFLSPNLLDDEDGRSYNRLYTPSEMAGLPKPEYLIDGVLPCRSMVVLRSDPAAGKSLLAQDWLHALIEGEEWHGRKVKNGYGVWIAGEGFGGLPLRLRAWCKHHKKDINELKGPAVWPVALDITSRESVDRFVDQMRRFGSPINPQVPELPILSLIVVDTLARCFGGGDENSAKDMGALIDGCEYLKRVTGATILILHHVGKDPTKGARGSSALRGAADVEIALSRKDEILILKCEKFKDGVPFSPITLKLNVIDLTPEFGEPTDSVVLVPDHRAHGFSNPTGPSGKWQAATMGAINSHQPIKYSEIKQNLVAQGCGERTAEKAIQSLTNKGLISATDDGYVIAPCK
jgi:hypothetical protein